MLCWIYLFATVDIPLFLLIFLNHFLLSFLFVIVHNYYLTKTCFSIIAIYRGDSWKLYNFFINKQIEMKQTRNLKWSNLQRVSENCIQMSSAVSSDESSQAYSKFFLGPITLLKPATSYDFIIRVDFISIEYFFFYCCIVERFKELA